MQKKYRRNTNVVKTKNGEIIPLSKYPVCNSKKLKFIKERQLEDYYWFDKNKSTDYKWFTHSKYSVLKYIMNETINKFLLARDKFKPEMHLRQPGFTYSASWTFTRNKIKKVRETGDSRCIYQN